MTEIVHSKLGASGMYRWAACPGSVRECEKAPSTISVYAAEGTVAHDIAANWLLSGKKPDKIVGGFTECEGHKIEITHEMVEALEVYHQTVQADAHPKDTLLVEKRFHLKSLHPGLFGTSDAVLIPHDHKTLRVYDYKHGSGVAVEVTDNSQLKYYALGVLLELNVVVDYVEIVLVQPRCYHADGPVRRQRIPTVDLLDFAAELLEAVKRTEDPEAPLVPGDHCRWCNAAAICPALKEKAMEMAKRQFSPINQYDPQVLAETMEWLPVLEAWIKSVREFAYGEAQHGRPPPGYKLVEKVGRRKWIDPHTAAQALAETGIPETDLFTDPELRSPAQIEKILKKEQKPLLDLISSMESSGSTLVPESDKRPALKTDAATEFAPIN